MAHISSLGNSIFTSLHYSAADRTGFDAEKPLDWRGLFVVNAAAAVGDTADDVSAIEVGNVREFPSFGTPSNIVNVPVYGQGTSSQVQGQSDAPSLEFTLNYIPTEHAKLDALRLAGTEVAWRIRIADSKSAAVGTDTNAYEDFFFLGKVASFEITPSLSDSTQATMALTISGEFYGPFSADAALDYYGIPQATPAAGSAGDGTGW